MGDELAGEAQWARVTSGYYLLYPQLERSQGHVTKFMLDDAAVFYYESLNTNISTVRTHNSFSMSMDLSLGEGMPEGEYELRSRFYPMTYDSDPRNIYLNESFVLTAGSAHTVELEPMEADSHVGARYDAVVEGPDGRLFAFGFVKHMDGAWYNEYQY